MTDFSDLGLEFLYYVLVWGDIIKWVVLGGAHLKVEVPTTQTVVVELPLFIGGIFFLLTLR